MMVMIRSNVYIHCLLFVETLIFSLSSGSKQPPYIRSDHTTNQLSVSTGGTAKIDCWVYGSPPINVTWYKNNELLQDSSHMKIIANHSLIIRSIHLNTNHNDGGKYYCIAKNKHGVYKSQVTTINVRYLDNHFKGPKDATVFYKENHVFKCILPNGYPKPKFMEWQKDGVSLNPNSLDANVRLREIDGVNILKIKSAEYKNSGQYSCVARNPEGERISPEAMLRVIPKKGPPKIAIVSPIKVHIGGEAKIHCDDISNNIGSGPGPLRIWSKIDDEMPSGNRLTQRDDGFLIISKVKKSDAGRYKCAASDGIKSSSAYGDLQVFDQPYLVIQPTDTSVPLYSTVTLTCEVANGIHPNIYWRHGSVTYNKKQMHYTRVIVSDNKLTIRNIQYNDEGIIKCLVDDGEIEIRSADVKLTVLKTTKSIPKISLAPKNASVVESKQHTISCLNLGDEMVTFEWIHAANNRRIFGNNNDIDIKVYVDGTNLTFRRVKAGDAGVYRCKVIGAGGTSTLISKLDVKLGVPPKLPFLEVTKISDTSVELKWLNPTFTYTLPINSYVILTQNQLTGEEKDSVFIRIESRNMFATIRNLDRLSSYIFSIAATNDAGRGDFVDSSLIHMSSADSKTPTPSLNLFVTDVTFNSINVKWTELKKREITEHVLYVHRIGLLNKYRLKQNTVEDAQYTIRNLQPATDYQIRLKAVNVTKDIALSRFIDVKTLIKIETIAVQKIDNDGLMVMWKPPNNFKSIKGVIGYEVSCLHYDRTSFFTAKVNKRAKKYLLSGLDPWKKYIITVFMKTNKRSVASSMEITVRLDKMQIDEVTGISSDSSLVPIDKKKVNSISNMFRQPWFIVATAVLIWILLMVAVICVVKACKARSKKSYESSMEFDNSLLAGRLDYSNNTLQNLASWRKNGSDIEFQTCPRKTKVNNCCLGKKSSMGDEFLNRADIKPRISYSKNESVSSYTKPGTYDLIKDSNNIVVHLNNEINHNHHNHDRNHQPCIVSNGDYPRMLLRRTSQEQTAPPYSGSRRECDSVERRHAEILRSAGTKPDTKPVNVLDSNPHSAWKHISKESPKLKKTPGEDSLRRQQKFKPLPNLEVLNWANGLPASNSSQSDSVKDESQFSATSSPKMSPPASGHHRQHAKVSMDGSIPSQMTPDDEKHRRRISNTSSMVSSELYQSELDPSPYSDTASERRRKKERSLPPPIGIEGLTSDILLQWAESVTNSSASSSESSSPTRLSGMSSDGGSIFTDQNFAKAVAAVAECGGFSLGNATSTPNRFIPHVSMSNYISGVGKLPVDMCTTPPLPRTKTNKKNTSSLDKNLIRYGTGFQDVDSVSSAAKPLTKSNLKQHNSSLERGNGKEVKNPPLIVSNLREHDSSLDHGRRHPSKRPLNNSNFRERSNTAPGNNIQMPEAPLSLTSALERNECLDSKDSLNSSKEDSEVEKAGTSERKPKRFR